MIHFCTKKEIEGFPLLYTLLRFYSGICSRFYYKSISYVGWENIPKKGPVIFAPNHQNALMDALAVAIWQKRPVVFMARADIFRKKFARYLLRLIKIMPVYRMKDGYSKLSKNEQQFQEAACVLINNGTLCLMPEGNQDGHRRLRPLVKGLFRIAIETQRAVGKSRDVQIVPVGIDYSEYEHPRADVVVHFGKAILVSNYAGFYDQDPLVGLNILRDELAGRLENLMQNIQDQSHYQEIYLLSNWFSPAFVKSKGWKNNAVHRFEARRILSQRLEDMFSNQPESKQKLASLYQVLQDLPGNTEDKLYWLSKKDGHKLWSVLRMLLLSLAIIPSCMLNWLIRIVIRSVVRRDKDPQMHSSYRFALSALLLPLWYVLLSSLIALVLNLSLLRTLILFVAIALTAYLGEGLLPLFRREISLWRLKRTRYSGLRSRLISTLEKLQDISRDLFVA